MFVITTFPVWLVNFQREGILNENLVLGIVACYWSFIGTFHGTFIVRVNVNGNARWNICGRVIRFFFGKRKVLTRLVHRGEGSSCCGRRWVRNAYYDYVFSAGAFWNTARAFNYFLALRAGRIVLRVFFRFGSFCCFYTGMSNFHLLDYAVYCDKCGWRLGRDEVRLAKLLRVTPFRKVGRRRLITFLFNLPGDLGRFRPNSVVTQRNSLYGKLCVLTSKDMQTKVVGSRKGRLAMRRVKTPGLLTSTFVFTARGHFPIGMRTVKPYRIFMVNGRQFLRFVHLRPLVVRGFLGSVSSEDIFLDEGLGRFTLLGLGAHLLGCLRARSIVRGRRRITRGLKIAHPSLTETLSRLIGRKGVGGWVRVSFL